MLNTIRNLSPQATGLRAALAALLLTGSGVAAAANIDLCAVTGSTVLPPASASVTVPVLGYAIGSATSCPTSVTSPGGPILTVTAGDTITLHNALADVTGLLFPGLGLVPDASGVSAGGTKTYTVPTITPGTYLYQATTLANAERQVAMGLYGALVVRAPDVTRTDSAVTTNADAVVTDSSVTAADIGSKVSGPGIPIGATIVSVVAGTSFTMSAPATTDGSVSIVLSKGSAYGDTATSFDDEAILVLSEIDPVLNANPSTFDMRNFAPKYFLINGKAYPDTARITSAASHKLLLRYVNAGARHHSMATLGLRQNFIAKDASQLPTAAVSVAAETLAAGQTADALISVPAAGAGSFAVYDASLHLYNGSSPGFGGMMTFVDAGTANSAAGPTTSAVTVAPNPTDGSSPVTLNSSITASGTATVDAAEYFIDAKGTDSAGTAMTGTFGTATVAATSSVSADTLASGNHAIFVHGHDTSGTGAWGAYSFVVLNVDKAGPMTSALVLTSNPSSGAVPVALSASASDTATGGSNIVAAQYTIDGGAAVAMNLGGAVTPVRSVTATIPAGLAPGAHAILVRGQDALLNWGAWAPITLTVSQGGPTTTSIILTPNPNNGTYKLSSGQPVLRVTATMTGASSFVTGAEAFIDSNPAVTVRGFVFTPTDGKWNATTETGYADIPIANIGALSTGTHTIYVRGKDSTGTWGATAPATLTIDRTAPVLISGALVEPTTVAYGTPSVTLNFSATDTGGALAGVQFWFDGSATTPPANPPTAAGTTSASINTSTLAGGVHTVYFRARDTANNVSTLVLSAPLTVVRAANDNRTFNSNTNATQQSDANAAAGVLANDRPVNAARTVAITTAPSRTAGAGSGTISVTCPASLGTGAVPAISGDTICTNGAYRVTLTGSGANGAARQASKRGTYQFTYTMTLSGVSSTGTVTITVN